MARAVLAIAVPCLVAAWVGMVAAATTERCDGPLCIATKTAGDTVRFVARNTDPVMPMTVTFTLAQRVAGSDGRRVTVLLPGQTQELMVVRPGAAGDWAYRYAYTWMPGDLRARADPRVIYDLPFRNAALPVIQSCNGWFSHRRQAQQAIDIAMPVGTPVRAAREGRVIFVKMDSRRGGRSRAYIDDDNRVLVQHEDGSVATYAHLGFASARVRAGQRVGRGEVLALSGNTGFSAQPHLHFELFTPTADGGRAAWPVSWRVAGQIVRCPARGRVLRN